MTAPPEIRAHQEWIGFLQPVGLVVSTPALVAAQAILSRNVVPQQQVLTALVTRDGADRATLTDLPRLCIEVLGWEPADLAGAPSGPELPRSLDVSLQEYGELLAPTYAVADPERPASWLLLLEQVGPDVDLDVPLDVDERRWHASPQARFERLLRANDVAIGLLANGAELRLVYAPRGESSGYVTFPVTAM